MEDGAMRQTVTDFLARTLMRVLHSYGNRRIASCNQAAHRSRARFK